ncbi:hypothetical protein J28TS4_39720 [Paenibacillus lautus]|uniref:S-layer homology domain-containing protein n=1 Tax=Paenibacillus lautus TaxID=1401 RepID=UPI001B032762|nr:S-layer homology domain-containing protein [Paenibacillus lautus]GIP05565.1 hypothetical protein J28TS4_39720 [Paenibacillus lautus]
MHITKALKKPVFVMIMLIFSLSIMTTAWAAQPNADDLQGHWAETRLRSWSDQGLLQGYNGKFNPDRPVTRAELVTLINRSFEVSEPSSISFKDLETSHWAYDQIARAVKAGYIDGYNDNTVRPDHTVTREEAAVMVAKLTELVSAETVPATDFKDDSSISKWSKPAVSALAEKAVITGSAKGNFNPQGKLTRAEAVTLLDKSLEYKVPTDITYDKAGTYGPTAGVETIKGNVIVAAPGVTLQNVVIEGNLTLTEAVGEGDAFFKKVNVKGTTTIQGGGANSVHFEDSVLVRVSVDKQTGTVRVVVVGESAIQHVVVHSPVKLEESSVTDSGFANVEIAKNMPQGSEVQLVGQFEDVRVLSSDIKVSIPSGSVKQLNVEEGAKNTEINVNANASVMDLVLNAVAKLLGQGTIANATVNADAAGSTFQKRPGAVAGDAANTITAPPASGSTAGSGNNSGNNSSNNGGGVVDGGSGGNDGGNNGSNPGPGNGGGNGGEPVPCTGTADQCRDARLVDLTVSGFTMNQLDANEYTTGVTGFSPDTFEYSIVTDRSMTQPVPATVSVTKATYHKVDYTVWEDGANTLASGTITDENPAFNLEIKGMKDVRVRLTVTSGDGIGKKVYEIFIQYPRTIQEGLKIGSHKGTHSNNGVLVGEKMYYNLIKGNVGGIKLGELYTVLLYEPNASTPFLTCQYTSCNLPDGKFAKDTAGTWRVEILRDGAVVDSGDYQYDFMTAPMLTNDIGLRASAVTKQELIDFFLSGGNFTTPFKYGYLVYADMSKLRAEFPTAKFFVEGSYEMYMPTSSLPSGLSVDELKGNLQPYGYQAYQMSSLRPIPSGSGEVQLTGGYYHQSDYDNEKIVNDKVVYLSLYDENRNIIGQYVTILEFDQDHVADGFTPSETWQPTP